MTHDDRCTVCLGHGEVSIHNEPSSDVYSMFCAACDGAGTRIAQREVTLRDAKDYLTRCAVRYWIASMALHLRDTDQPRITRERLFSAARDYYGLADLDLED
ncbi:MAG: hypothetical protein A2Y78_08390 [Acidobacteria bacterium RBG_13_68_16]|nr:MAG: hypothetical protein A2Y78_08390 [Acidobacteria bacterium RBG_13_68_16]